MKLDTNGVERVLTMRRLLLLLSILFFVVACSSQELSPTKVEPFGRWTGFAYFNNYYVGKISVDYDLQGWEWCHDSTCVYGQTSDWDLILLSERITGTYYSNNRVGLYYAYQGAELEATLKEVVD